MVEREEVKFTSPHKCIKNASTNGRILTEHWLNISRGLRHQKGQERPRHNQVGWKKEEGRKKRRGRGMGTAPLAGERKERRGFHKGGSLLTVGRSVGQNGSTGLSEVSTTTGECGRTGWDLYSWSVPQPKMCVHWYRWGLGSESWVWKANPERRLLWATKRQPEGIGVRKPITLNACGGNPDSTEAKRHCWVMCKGQPLTTQWLLPHCALGRLPARLTFTSPWPLAKAPHFSPGWLSCECSCRLPHPCGPSGHHRILFTLSPA